MWVAGLLWRWWVLTKLTQGSLLPQMCGLSITILPNCLLSTVPIPRYPEPWKDPGLSLSLRSLFIYSRFFLTPRQIPSLLGLPCALLQNKGWTALVVRWLRVCLPM